MWLQAGAWPLTHVPSSTFAIPQELEKSVQMVSWLLQSTARLSVVEVHTDQRGTLQKHKSVFTSFYSLSCSIISTSVGGSWPGCTISVQVGQTHIHYLKLNYVRFECENASVWASIWKFDLICQNNQHQLKKHHQTYTHFIMEEGKISSKVFTKDCTNSKLVATSFCSTHSSVSARLKQVRWRWTTCPSPTLPWWPPTRWLCCWPSTTARRWPTRSCRTAPRWTRRSFRRPSSPCWTSRCSTTTRKRSEPDSGVLSFVVAIDRGVDVKSFNNLFMFQTARDLYFSTSALLTGGDRNRVHVFTKYEFHQ